jgi:hypothetical protein
VRIGVPRWHNPTEVKSRGVSLQAGIVTTVVPNPAETKRSRNGEHDRRCECERRSHFETTGTPPLIAHHRRVLPAVVVPAVPERQHRFVVLPLLGVSVGQPRHPSAVHPRAEIVALDVQTRDSSALPQTTLRSKFIHTQDSKPDLLCTTVQLSVKRHVSRSMAALCQSSALARREIVARDCQNLEDVARVRMINKQCPRTAVRGLQHQ